MLGNYHDKNIEALNFITFTHMHLYNNVYKTRTDRTFVTYLTRSESSSLVPLLSAVKDYIDKVVHSCNAVCKLTKKNE